jgi:hypothetical protein
MTWTPPDDWDVGEVLTAASLNKINANLNHLKDLAKFMKKGDGLASYSTTTLNSYVEISAALTITQTTYGGPVMMGLTGTMRLDIGSNLFLDIEIDGVRLGLTTGQNGGLVFGGNSSSGMLNMPVGLTFLTDTATPLAAGSHTFKPVFKTTSAANFFYNASVNGTIPTFWIRELS